MRKTVFAYGEYYHLYNRGVDKRTIFETPKDMSRFLQSMQMFNAIEVVGSIHAKSSRKKEKIRSSTPKSGKLVQFVTYCLNQNHYHFIVMPLVQEGVQKFMHRLSTGYTNYFNDTHTRSGSLFQGRYKAVHIETNEYLLHLSVYVNLNDRVHKNLNKPWVEKLPFSSFPQYSQNNTTGLLCDTSVILEQFKSKKEYVQYAESVLPTILKRKETEKLIADQVIEN